MIVPSSKSTGFSRIKFFIFFLFFTCSTLFSLPVLLVICLSFLATTGVLSSCLRSFNLPSTSSFLATDFLDDSVLAGDDFLTGLAFSLAFSFDDR